MSETVLPSTSAWAQQCIVAIYQAQGQRAFDSAFDAFISQKVQKITLNGKTLTRDQYKQQLSGEKLLERSASVTFNGTVDVPDTGAFAVSFLSVAFHPRI